jgi:hypothetical protein
MTRHVKNTATGGELLKILTRYGPCSAAEICRHTQLSVWSVGNYLRFLRRTGYAEVTKLGWHGEAIWARTPKLYLQDKPTGVRKTQDLDQDQEHREWMDYWRARWHERQLKSHRATQRTGRP